jgi:hypothetical protein
MAEEETPQQRMEPQDAQRFDEEREEAEAERFVREAEAFLGPAPTPEQLFLADQIQYRALRDGLNFNAAADDFLREQRRRQTTSYFHLVAVLAGILVAAAGFVFFSYHFMSAILDMLGMKNP